jgi:DNA polymerase-3 subunit delta
MTALKGAEIEAYIAQPDKRRAIALVFGPDLGLVRERVEALIAKSVDDPNDPFSLARLDGDALTEAPERLIDEALTVPLFGGRRAVWVKAAGKNIAPSVEMLLSAPPADDCRIVIEAGDLARNAPLRVLCERARQAVAIACYPDSERDLARLIDDEMRAVGLTVAPDARVLLLSLLGGDRQASRGEVQKVALYARGRERVELDDVLAVAADASMQTQDAIIDATFAGRPEDVGTHYARAREAGSPASVIAGAALRQAMQLHRARLAVEAGESVEGAVAGMRPPPHFKRKSAVEQALQAWTSARLERTLLQFADIVLECRRHAALADAVAERALLMTAQAARRRA